MWPAGILGLVASKIIEEYSITTFVWGSEGDSIKGSCRGVGDISVVKIMQSVSHLLTQFGGHEEAGGFTATRETIHFLEDAFNETYQATKHDVSKQITEISYDMELSLSDVTMDHYYALRQMAPFGMGNPKPVFAFKNITVQSVNQFGKTKEHLEIVLNNNVRAISWYATPTSFTHAIEAGKTITLLAEFDHSVFRGKHELRLMIVDVLQ
jgi:single-stranded-DNA-specific exonuclease